MDVQTILASGSENLSVSWLAEMVAMTAQMASLKLQLACLISRRSSNRSPSRCRSHSRPRTADVDAIREFPPTTSKRQLQRFLDMANFAAGSSQPVLTSCYR
ncbi:unnamed protein product [Schistocephalus solidus]|uniref:Uncharacterized protein n=1 Tax=Schistocephalus solidus TaxID=70667 RepID=A0A183SF20_SCHSO|nr:unnamed protein product [Schistocephalus solidus]